MVASVAATLLVVLGVASVATAQLETCNGDLPPVLAANYSGLACQPVWNNFDGCLGLVSGIEISQVSRTGVGRSCCLQLQARLPQ